MHRDNVKHMYTYTSRGGQDVSWQEDIAQEREHDNKNEKKKEDSVRVGRRNGLGLETLTGLWSMPRSLSRRMGLPNTKNHK